jgi:hypothetical protein
VKLGRKRILEGFSLLPFARPLHTQTPPHCLRRPSTALCCCHIGRRTPSPPPLFAFFAVVRRSSPREHMANRSALVPSLPLFPSCYGGIDVLDQCYAGTCVNGSCVCFAGWSGYTDYVPMDLSEWGGPVLSCGVFMPLIKVLWGISLVPGLMVMIMWVPAIMEQYKVRRPEASHHWPKGSNTRGPSSTLHTLVRREGAPRRARGGVVP